MSADPDLAKLPAPLVPSEINLRGLAFMPLDVQRLLDSDFYAKSSGDEFKAALTLWCKAFLQAPAGSLPSDDLVLAKLSGTDGRWRKLRSVALHGWVRCSDGRLYHRVVAEKVFETWKFRKAQRDRAVKRWSTPPEAPDVDATAMPRHHHGMTGEDATAYPTALPGQSPGNAAALPGQYHGNAIRSGVEGSGLEVPPPSPTTSSSSASSERARAREGGGGNGGEVEKVQGEKPAGNGSSKVELTNTGEWLGVDDAQRLRWQDMFDDLSIPDQLARAGAWLLVHPEERAIYEQQEDGMRAYIIRWLLREDRVGKSPAGH
jgi:hypothetical protein